MLPPTEYTVHGPVQAPWLTLSHPIGANLELWAPQVQAFAQNYRVLAYTTRGHGADRRPQTSCTVDELADDVLQLWQNLDISQSHFVGLSLGGCVGTALALRAPARLRSLVVACSRLQMDAPAREMWLQRASLVEQQGMAPVVEATLARWFTPGFLTSQVAAVERVRRTLLNTPAAGFAACARALSGLSLADRLPELKVATLFLAGQDDQAVSADLLRSYAQACPGAAFDALPGPHILNLENPQAFKQRVLAFLAQH